MLSQTLACKNQWREFLGAHSSGIGALINTKSLPRELLCSKSASAAVCHGDYLGPRHKDDEFFGPCQLFFYHTTVASLIVSICKMLNIIAKN